MHRLTKLSSVFSLSRPQTSQYRKSRIWEMKEDKYAKSLTKNQVCAIIHIRDDSEKRFTQICKALYGDAMLVSF